MGERKRISKEAIKRKEIKEKEVETGVVKYFDRNELYGRVYPDMGGESLFFSISGFRNIIPGRNLPTWSSKRERQTPLFDELPKTGEKIVFERMSTTRHRKKVDKAAIWGFNNELEKVKSSLERRPRYRIVADTPEGSQTRWTGQNIDDPALSRIKGGRFEIFKNGQWVKGSDPRRK